MTNVRLSLENLCKICVIITSHLVWKGNQVVTLVLSFILATGHMYLSVFICKLQVTCDDKASEKYISTGRPYIVKEYSRYMGGVDLICGMNL